MNDTTVDRDLDAKIRRYLLAELDEREAEEVEARYFSDAEFFARVDEAADKLSDDYVRGALSAHESAQIRQLTEHPDWQQRVRIAEALRQELAAAATAPVKPIAADATRFAIASWFRSQALGMRFGLAAAGLTVALGWPMFAVQLRQSQQNMVALQADFQTRVDAARSDAAVTHSESNSLRGRVAALEKDLTERSTVSLLLMTGMSRAEGDTLIVPRDAAFVRFQLALERPAQPHVVYRAMLRTADREIVWSREGIDLVEAPGGAPTVTVPAVVLRPGQYELVLQGPAGGGRFEEMATFSFRVTRR